MAFGAEVSTLESYLDTTRHGFQAVASFLASKKLERKRARDADRHEEKLPCRVSGEELQQLEKEFGWKMVVVDRGPTMAPFAVAKHHCLASLNRRIKAWDGEEVIEFDRDMMTMAVKNEGWLHSCRTYATSAVAAEYVRQEYALLKAVEGRRPDIAHSASSLLKEVKAGGGNRVCLDSAGCRRYADTLLIDLAKVDVSATQATETMFQHQATRVKLFFYFETDMYFQDEGDLTSMSGRYVVDRSADLVHIFPAGQTLITYTYSYSNMMSYVMESETVVDGRRAVIEVHDSKPGVCFVQISPVGTGVDADVEVETRFYRPSGESMVVMEQQWEPSDAVVDTPGLVFSRIVVPAALQERVHNRLMSLPFDKITEANARVAVRDNTNQVVNRVSTVARPARLPAHVPEQLALGSYKRALRCKIEMEVEQRALLRQCGLLGKDKFGYVQAAVSLVCRKGMSLVDAVRLVPDELLRGFEVVEDYNVSVYPLESGVVVRNVVSAKPRGSKYRSVSYMPGGKRTGSTISTTSSTDVLLSQARAAKLSGELDEIDRMYDEVQDIVEELDVKKHAPMTEERRDLVDKMKCAYDAHDKPTGTRERVRVGGQTMPMCSKEPVVDDPVGAVHGDYFDIFPELQGVDVQVRSHMMSAEERSWMLAVPRLVVNTGFDKLCAPQAVRRSKFLTAGGGKRPVVQTEVLSAISKRIAGAPRAQLDRDFMDTMSAEFERVSVNMFRQDWRTVVADRMDQGLWQSRASELGRNVSKLDTAKVSSMLRESFTMGGMDMGKWKIMAKTLPKPAMSGAIASEHKATQTIVYQDSKMTNSYHSSLLTEAHDVLDEILLPNVRVNVRRDRADQESWFNSWQTRRDSAGKRLVITETDISQCDKSHTVYNLLAYFHFWQQLGAPDDLVDVWSVMVGKKTASAAMVGLLVEFFEQLTSGGFHTISLNSILIFIATVNAMKLDKSSVVSVQITGDDGLVETVGPVDVVEASTHFKDMYNLESKTYTVKVPYFCGKYGVFVDGYWFWVKDPVKASESIGKFVAATADLHELHVAYVDDMMHYDKKEVMDQLAFDVAIRCELKFVPRSMVRGLASLLEESVYIASFDEGITELGA